MANKKTTKKTKKKTKKKNRYHPEEKRASTLEEVNNKIDKYIKRLYELILLCQAYLQNINERAGKHINKNGEPLFPWKWNGDNPHPPIYYMMDINQDFYELIKDENYRDRFYRRMVSSLKIPYNATKEYTIDTFQSDANAAIDILEKYQGRVGIDIFSGNMGVSLRYLRLILSRHVTKDGGNNNWKTDELRKEFHNRRDTLPEPIGYDPNHEQAYYYDPEGLVEWVEKFINIDPDVLPDIMNDLNKNKTPPRIK